VQCPDYNLGMRVLTLVSFFSTVLALPEGLRLRPEEHWRPAQAIDINNYEPMPRLFRNHKATEVDSTWKEEMVRINSVAAKMHSTNGLSYNRSQNQQPKIECGREGPSRHDKIYGGVEASPNQWPWMTAIFINGHSFCGGSIISERFILTAAHCIKPEAYYQIMVGVHNIRASNEPHRLEITSYNGYQHPDYDQWVPDIGLIKLPEPLTFNAYISPVCLPAKGHIANGGMHATVTGWGTTWDGEVVVTDKLRMVHDLPVITNEQCKQYHSGLLKPMHVCLDTSARKGSCHGDSGGPMIIKDGSYQGPGQKWIQHGIVSFGSGVGCATGIPDGYTRTEYYHDWIQSQIS